MVEIKKIGNIYIDLLEVTQSISDALYTVVVKAIKVESVLCEKEEIVGGLYAKVTN